MSQFTFSLSLPSHLLISQISDGNIFAQNLILLRLRTTTNIMSVLSEKFHEQYSRLQEQFDEWTPMEQFYALLGLSKKLQISYRYFLSQLLSQTNNQSENNDMFHHTIHQANTPGKNIN